jgi:2-isopropylmalate synthase
VLRYNRRAVSDPVLIRLLVNGEEHALAAPPQRTLLEALRYDLLLTGSKQGCDKGDCGACTVLVRERSATGRGEPILACITLAQDAQGLAITTIEGLATPAGLDPVQQAFADCGALQCGFCQPGMMLSARALLDRCAKPSLPQIQDALSGNLCRCTGYTKIYEAIEVAAGLREPASRMPVRSEKAAPSDQIAHAVKELLP